MARQINPQDNWREMLLKNIPSEVIVFYVAVLGLIAAADSPGWLIWISFGVGFAAVPLWLIFGQGVRSWFQNILATASFPIWDMSLAGGAFSTIPGWKPIIGSVFLLIFTMVVAPLVSLILKPKS